MKNLYFTAGDKFLAFNPKAASSSLARAIATAYCNLSVEQLAQPKLQSYLDIVNEPDGEVILVVRDPVERFRSACAETGKEVDDALTEITNGEHDLHLWPTSRLLVDGCKLYRFESDLDDAATALGLTLPLPDIDGGNGEKPDLTPEQLARVQAIYADDIALYESITEAGQVWTKPPTPTTDVDKVEKLAKLAAARYAEEMEGIEVDGILIKTDERTRGILTAGMVEVRDNPEFLLLNWKISDGNFVDLSALQILSIYEAVDAHIAATFAKERTLSEQVTNATTIEELEAINW
jgi:hypothetical protein